MLLHINTFHLNKLYAFTYNEKQIKGISKRFQKNKAVAIQWINNSFLSEEYKEKYKALMEKRYRTLFQRE